MIRDYSSKATKRDRAPSRRTTVFFAVILLGATVLFGKLVYLMGLQHALYSALASDQQEIYQKLFPERGDIAVRDAETGELVPIATNRMMSLVYADPRKIKDPIDATDKLAPLLGIEIPEDKPENAEARVAALQVKQVLLNKLAKFNDPYEVLKHAVPDDVVEKIKALNIDGIRFFDERVRFYPEPDFGGHITGFLGSDATGNRVGRYGAEGFFERELAGQPGFLQTAQGAQGGWISLSERQLQPAEDGSTVVLTINKAIQFFACERLRETVIAHGAERGAIVILDAKTGAVLALCSAPDFDPNNYRDVPSVDVFNNAAIYGAYEPGSVMKAMTMAAAIDAGVLSPNSTYEDKGKIELGNVVIKNSDLAAHGIQTMTQVLEKSLNTGAFYAEEKLPPGAFKRYLEDFGFGETTGIELDTESHGTLASLDKDGRVFRATASFGQGITATTLQVADAFLAIANHGRLLRPYVVEKIVSPSGRETVTPPQTIRQVISERAAALVSAMLVSVVERGHGQKAGVKGYYVAGKTGTAQIARKDGPGYEIGRSIGTFAGFAPVEDPRFVMVTRIDAPKDAVFAEVTAAPLFGEIAKFLLQYMEVPTTR